MFMIRAAEDGDPGHPAPPSPAAFASNLLSVCRRKIGRAFNVSLPAPADSLLPCRPGPAQPGLPVCGAARRSPRSSALSTGDRLFGIYPRRCACLFICSLFHGSKKQFLLPLISPLHHHHHHTPFSSTHSTILPPTPTFLFLPHICS